MNRLHLPERSGAYRWYYADVTAGDFTAVFIFMLGSVFSARYSASLKKGGLPREHAAVNFALYEKGVRWQWVLTEYQDVKLEDGGRTLKIGTSSVSYRQDRLVMTVKDRATPFGGLWGEPVEAVLELEPEGPLGEELRLVESKPHFWRPIAARAKARLSIASHGLQLEGRGYHDGNHGEVPLGTDVSGWEWHRVHTPQSTEVTYRPWDQQLTTHVRVSAQQLDVTRGSSAAPATVRTGWGLQVPQQLSTFPPAVLLESSPFYARMEAERPDGHALGEVADFARFHQPSVRWLASLRTRQGGR